jgi:DNA-binding transcriptional regulator YhcF (GntR family)
MDITDFKIDQHSKESLHLQVAEQVRNLIAMEKLKPGDHLPPVRRLAEFLNINQNTILRAYLLQTKHK